MRLKVAAARADKRTMNKHNITTIMAPALLTTISLTGIIAGPADAKPHRSCKHTTGTQLIKCLASGGTTKSDTRTLKLHLRV